MVYNVYSLSHAFGIVLAFAIEEAAHLLGIDAYIDLVEVCKGCNLQVIPVGTPLCHCLQVLLKC